VTGTVVLSAATVHEAAGGIGALPSVIKSVDPGMRVVGPAFPVRMPPGDNLWLHRAVYAARPGDVLVVDCCGGLEHGYFGEVLAEAALARSLAGLVIHGGVRDVCRLCELGWPVFAERTCIRGTTKDPDGDGQLGAPVRIGDVEVAVGDLVVGDTDGVVCVPAALAGSVRERAAERDRTEEVHIARLRGGATTLDIYGL
jgi:4-hydroxy-4-methyl-2-oxoglutarate aldolase